MPLLEESKGWSPSPLQSLGTIICEGFQCRTVVPPIIIFKHSESEVSQQSSTTPVPSCRTMTVTTADSRNWELVEESPHKNIYNLAKYYRRLSPPNVADDEDQQVYDCSDLFDDT